MNSRGDTKAARLVALGHAIQEGYFDPGTVNMSDLARTLGVNRSTILKDLRVISEILDESKQIQTTLRNTPTTTTRRKS